MLCVFFSLFIPFHWNSWVQFDTIPKRTIYQIMDIKLMRMRLAPKKKDKATEWSISLCFTIILWFLWTGYYVIGIYSFFCGDCAASVSMLLVYFPMQFIIDIMFSLILAWHTFRKCEIDYVFIGQYLLEFGYKALVVSGLFTFHIHLSLSFFYINTHTYTHTQQLVFCTFIHRNSDR